MDEQSKTTIIAALAARAKEPAWDREIYYPDLDAVQIIYEGTPEGCPARALMVDLYTEHVTIPFSTEEGSVMHKDFLRDLSISLLAKRTVSKYVKVLETERDHCRKEVGDKVKQIAVLEKRVTPLGTEVAWLKPEGRASSVSAEHGSDTE